MSILEKWHEKYLLFLGKLFVGYGTNDSPVHVYPDVKIDLTPNSDLYSGLSEEERLEKIRQNLAYVWADGVESPKWKKRGIPYIGIRLHSSLVLHEMIGCGRGWNLAKARKLAAKCEARFLFPQEYKEVLYCWDTITRMRLIAGDFPLEKDLFWLYTGSDKEQADELKYDLCFPNGEVIWYSEWDDEGNVLLALR